MEKHIFLIGTGLMAIDYTKVLNALALKYTVIGRGQESAMSFQEKTGINAIIGGVEKYISEQGFPENSYVIIATGTESLMPTLLNVLNAGVAKVLVEKPAAISIEELISNEDKLTPYLNNIFVAYNRRFYSSVIETQKLIAEDGGLMTMCFEFTEWAHKIEPLQKADGVKENWFFANSTHVVDLAFYFAGKPIEWKTFCKEGSISWHKKSNFSGAGITEKDVMFSYISNWESAGRWSIELMTNKRRIYLKPLEGIGIQLKGTINISEHTFNDTIDKQFKPGLFLQTESFLNGEFSKLVNIQEHITKSKEIYWNILK